MLPLRSRLGEDAAFADYLAQMKNLVLNAADHQDYFFGNLVGRLGLPRDPARAPLFNVVFNLETGEFKRQFSRVALELETRDVPYRSPRGTAMFNLYLNAAERANGEILVQCDHNAALIEPETMCRWLAHFETLLREIASNPDRKAAELSLWKERKDFDLHVPQLESHLTPFRELSTL